MREPKAVLSMAEADTEVTTVEEVATMAAVMNMKLSLVTKPLSTETSLMRRSMTTTIEEAISKDPTMITEELRLLPMRSQ